MRPAIERIGRAFCRGCWGSRAITSDDGGASVRCRPLPGDDTQAARDLAVQPDPLGEISMERHTTALRRALLELPVRYREIIVLCDLQELSYADAADALGCAVGTVRSRLHRGRALLARRLCDPEDGLICRMPATRSIV